MLRKIFYLLKFLFLTKKIFKNPDHKKILIFDCESPCLRRLLVKDSVGIISTRLKKIEKIYISFDIINYILKNFFRRSIKINYLIILIRKYCPKVVVTYIDNSQDFYLVSKVLERDMRFIAIQQATSEIKYLPFKFKKKKNIPEFHCLSKYDLGYFKKKKISVKKYFISGSLKSSIALSNIKKGKINIKKNLYDICLISEGDIQIPNKNYKIHRGFNRDFQSIDDLDHVKKAGFSYGKLAEFVYKVAYKNNLKVIIAGKYPKNSPGRLKELSFYNFYLKNLNYNLIPRPKELSSYYLVLQSKIVVATCSTLLREAVGLNCKVLACNLSGHRDLDFPIKKHLYFNKHSFDKFEKKFLDLYKMPKKKYFKFLGKNKNYIMEAPNNFEQKLRKRLISLSEPKVVN